jgi:tetratricopeptide (TPR) repeat protein
MSFAGQPAEALRAVDHAMRLNPKYPSSHPYQRGLALFAGNRVGEAVVALEQALAINPDDYWTQRLWVAAYGLLDRGDDGKRLFGAMKGKTEGGQNSYDNPITIKAMAYWYPFANPADGKRLAAGLAKAGVPD